MNPMVLRVGLGLVCAVAPTMMAGSWVRGAGKRLAKIEAGEVVADDADDGEVAIATAADEGYCNGDLRKILRRVLQSCGLLGSGEVRGCQPVQAKNVATMTGEDFNALFLPLSQRAGIIQFDKDSAELDPQDTGLLDKVFADQRGASYFFVVARSSPEGSADHNRDLSQKRADAVMSHLRTTFKDPDLDREVGMLWLGEEYAQLDQDFCQWSRSGAADKCKPKDLNRSAFVAWIDCRL
jgi:outer membrane protein OmpA-like peptidoglycan-associated protein